MPITPSAEDVFTMEPPPVLSMAGISYFMLSHTHAALRAAAFHVEHMIGGDPVEPSAELAFPFERAELGDDLDQHLLRDFFGGLRMEDHADRDVVNPRLMSK